MRIEAPSRTEIAAHARQALALMDHALEEKPHREGATFTEAARHLCGLRDGLLACRDRTGADLDREICHVNSVISVVLAGHFPLGAVPWDELKKARAWMADYVTEHAA